MLNNFINGRNNGINLLFEKLRKKTLLDSSFRDLGRGVKKLKKKDGDRVLIWEVRYEALKKDITTTTKGFLRIFRKVENFL